MDQAAYNELNADEVAAAIADGTISPADARAFEAARDGDDRVTVLRAADAAETTTDETTTDDAPAERPHTVVTDEPRERLPRTEIAQPVAGLAFDDGDPAGDEVAYRRDAREVGIPSIDPALEEARDATRDAEESVVGISATRRGDEGGRDLPTLDPELERVRAETAAREAELADRPLIRGIPLRP